MDWEGTCTRRYMTQTSNKILPSPLFAQDQQLPNTVVEENPGSAARHTSPCGWLAHSPAHVSQMQLGAGPFRQLFGS